MKKGPVPGSEAARRGGQATAAKYGPEHFRALGLKGGASTAKRGREYYREAGKKGGEVTLERHGREHMAEIGQRGGLSRGKG